MSDKSWEPDHTLTLSHSHTLRLSHSHHTEQLLFSCLCSKVTLSFSFSHSHTLTLSISHSLTLNMLNNFCFHVYAQKSLSHSLTLSISHSLTLNMLNNFCFHFWESYWDVCFRLQNYRHLVKSPGWSLVFLKPAFLQLCPDVPDIAIGIDGRRSQPGPAFGKNVRTT